MDENPRILLVEDDEQQRQLIVEVLNSNKTGLTSKYVTAVSTGEQCLREDLKSFDVILLDYYLPDINGMDLLDAVIGETDVPVVFVTGGNDSAIAGEALCRGAQDYIVKLGDYLMAIPLIIQKSLDQYRLRKEKERLEGELEATLIQLQIKNTQLEESLDRLEKMAATDFLTGLPNRRRFNESLNTHYDEAKRYKLDMACCMCDLDDYKLVNDMHGHQVGDEILTLVADVIRSTLRSSDVAARYGGDEFVLLLRHTSVEKARIIGQRIFRQIAAVTSAHPKLQSPVKMSVGIVSLSEDCPPGPEGMIAMADEALYAAKSRGKNQIVAYCDIKNAAVI